MTAKWGMRTERETLSSQLHDLFEKAWKTSSIQVEEEWRSFRARITKTIETLTTTNKIFERLEITGKERVLTRTVFHLFAAEGGFVNHMDFVCLLLNLPGTRSLQLF